MIDFDSTVCRDLAASTSREWLETNGLGGFASSTISGMNTRRYHGLLVAAVRPPTERAVLLSKLEETLVVGVERYELSTNRYPQSIHPQGFAHQTRFRLAPFPVSTFRAADVEVEKSVFMLYDENTTVVRYHIRATGGQRIGFEVRPLIAFRDYHSMAHANPAARFPLEFEHRRLRITSDTTPYSLLLAHDAARVVVDGAWYKNFELAEEQARGFDFTEDLYNPCTLFFEAEGEARFDIIASTERRDVRDADEFERRERERRNRIAVDLAVDGDEYVGALCVAADQFIVRRGANLHTVIAGYHWFTDWGRDTMISLTGLALATHRFNTAREILLAFAAHLDRGLIPNRFPDAGDQPEYNTVDGTLWFVHAVGEYLRRTGDADFVREHLFDKLKQVIDWHERGTHYNIRVGDDGLLHAGADGVQLTWMDARVGDWVVTPRRGKPVEIEALWHNALRTVEELARLFDDQAAFVHCRALADTVHARFNEQFWNGEANCLYDCISSDGTPDPSLRPNQIFAVSLPHALISGERARLVVERVERELLTPFGLRSLARDDKDYHPRYAGDSLARDGGYHQGTVWGWLIGPFITAYLRVHERTPESIERARGMLSGFRAHLSEAGLGQVSEIFDAEPPHTPRGCVAQAWSVAEVLRCELEELR